MIGGLASADRSLARALSLRLVLALGLIATAGAAISAAIVDRYANIAYDRALADDIQVLASELRYDGRRIGVDLPPVARAWLLSNEGERVLYRVVDLRDGSVVDGNGDLGPLPESARRSATATFRNTRLDGARFRVATVYRELAPDGAWALVQVAETLGQRARIVSEIVIGALGVFAAMAACGLAAVWTGVRGALRPLGQLEAEAALRSSTDLRPLDPALAPHEVRGIVVAINRLMARLSRSIDAQDRFIANAAHQLRTPLAGLRLQAELGLDQAGDAPLRHRWNEVAQCATRASHLVDQLLTLARAEAGASRAPAERVDLVPIAHAVVAQHLDRAASAGIDLGYDGVAAAAVAGHALLLREALANLVDNAIRYVPSGGRVTVSVAQAQGGTVLAVADDGPGLPETVARDLFGRFVRGDVDAAAGTGGAGLGLAIVKEIADLHGAAVVHRTREPAGTRIELRFGAAGPAGA